MADDQREPDDTLSADNAKNDVPESPASETSEIPATPASGHPKQIGRYHVEKLLGKGGFGAVYLGHDPDLDRLVALKVLRPDRFNSEQEGDHFLTEAKTAANLEHPGVVAVHEVIRDGKNIVIVQRFIDGHDLRERLNHGPLEPRNAAEALADIAQAVSFAHRKGFVHRDLKPSNILLDNEGHPYVADFGLAIHESVQRHRRGERSGTPAYMSPEQVRGETHQLDGRSDIWSLGVVFYEMLSGRTPFSGESYDEICDEIEHRDPKPIRQIMPQVPPELERICLKAMSKSVTDRYLTASDMARDLHSFLASQLCQAEFGPDVLVRQAGGRHWRYLGWIGGVITALLLLVLLAIANTWWGNETDRSEDSEPASSLSAGRTRDVGQVSRPLEVLDFSVSYIRSDPDGDQRMGLVGREVWQARRGDAVRLSARFSRPAYAYLLALRADGQVELCWPDDEAAPPPRTHQAEYPPPTDLTLMYGLDEGAGLWAFFVFASDKRLPSYQDWIQSHDPPPWTMTTGIPGTVWRVSPHGLDEVTATSGQERSKGRVFRSPEPLERIVRWSESEVKIDVLEGIAFTAQPRR